MKETVGVIIEPTHILQIHRIPGEHGKIRQVISELKNVKVIKHRSKQEVKITVLPHHSTKFATSSTIFLRSANPKCLILNGKMFVQDHQGIRYKFDILDSVDMKLKNSKFVIAGATIRSGPKDKEQ